MNERFDWLIVSSPSIVVGLMVIILHIAAG